MFSHGAWRVVSDTSSRGVVQFGPPHIHSRCIRSSRVFAGVVGTLRLIETETKTQVRLFRSLVVNLYLICAARTDHQQQNLNALAPGSKRGLRLTGNIVE